MKIKVGDYVSIIYTEDEYLQWWLYWKKEKGITKFKVIEIDEEMPQFWLEDCPYSIWANEDEYIRR